MTLHDVTWHDMTLHNILLPCIPTYIPTYIPTCIPCIHTYHTYHPIPCHAMQCHTTQYSTAQHIITTIPYPTIPYHTIPNVHTMHTHTCTHIMLVLSTLILEISLPCKTALLSLHHSPKFSKLIVDPCTVLWFWCSVFESSQRYTIQSSESPDYCIHILPALYISIYSSTSVSRGCCAHAAQLPGPEEIATCGSFPVPGPQLRFQVLSCTQFINVPRTFQSKGILKLKDRITPHVNFFQQAAKER